MDQPNPGRLPLGDEELGDALRHLHFSAERAPCPKEAQVRQGTRLLKAWKATHGGGSLERLLLCETVDASSPFVPQARYLLLQAFLEGASELDNVARLHLEGLIGECRQRLDRLMVDDAIVAEE